MNFQTQIEFDNFSMEIQNSSFVVMLLESESLALQQEQSPE